MPLTSPNHWIAVQRFCKAAARSNLLGSSRRANRLVVQQVSCHDMRPHLSQSMQYLGRRSLTESTSSHRSHEREDWKSNIGTLGPLWLARVVPWHTTTHPEDVNPWGVHKKFGFVSKQEIYPNCNCMAVANGQNDQTWWIKGAFRSNFRAIFGSTQAKVLVRKTLYMCIATPSLVGTSDRCHHWPRLVARAAYAVSPHFTPGLVCWIYGSIL